MNKITITTILIISCLLALTLCATAKPKKAVLPKEVDEPLIHDYLKLVFWLISGVIVGVYF